MVSTGHPLKRRLVEESGSMSVGRFERVSAGHYIWVHFRSFVPIPATIGNCASRVRSLCMYLKAAIGYCVDAHHVVSINSNYLWQTAP